MKTQEIKFVKPVIRQGNSLCVRIQNADAKKLALNEKDLVEVSMKKAGFDISSENFVEFGKSIKKIPGLVIPNNEKLWLFYILVMKEGERAFKDGKKKKRSIEEIKKYEKRLAKDFGERTVKEYMDFRGKLYKNWEKLD